MFRIKGTDKRREFVSGDLVETQVLRGRDVERFTPEDGFYLREVVKPLNYSKKSVQRARSAAKLSLGAPLELREFYYTLGGDPNLVKAFEDCKADAVYSEVLRAIQNVEILCDVGRETFVIGNLSKGFIYYYHSERYSDKDRKIAFTEKLARSVMSAEELDSCGNIIVVEKNATANRLVSLGMSELTNSVVVTAGGNFNRAIWELTKRFKDTKNIIFLADGDVYGVDMLRTIQVGTKSTRHREYKFPPSRNANIYLSGLYPSIAENLGVPNDKEQKRPSQRPATRRRIRFLEEHGLLDPRDRATWLDRDRTYELEALSAAFKNKRGEPVGSAIYLIEYMRLMGIPVKPPLPPDDELEAEFIQAAYEELRHEIEEKLQYPKVVWDLYWHFERAKKNLIEEIFTDLKEEYDRALREVTAKEIKFHIYKQFEEDPERATYDLRAIAHKLKEKFEITPEWKADELTEKVEDALEEYKEEVVEFVKDVVFRPIHNETTIVEAYDLILRKLGADPEDCRKVREALEKRFK